MNTIKVRPVLVENKEITEIWSNKGRRLHYNQANFNDPDNTIYYQLILISLEGEKIEVGDLMYDFNDGITKNIGQGVGDFKIIATQDQLSPELINQLIIEYNNGGMKDFEIEMMYKEKPNSSIENWNYFPEPLLTNGFVTVVEKEHSYNLLCNMQYYMEYCQENGYVTPQEWLKKFKHYTDKKEPILYTEEEVKELYDLTKTIIYSLSSMISSYELKNLSLEIAEFENWFNKNKKK